MVLPLLRDADVLSTSPINSNIAYQQTVTKIQPTIFASEKKKRKQANFGILNEDSAANEYLH